jgi:hypothetical protein
VQELTLTQGQFAVAYVIARWLFMTKMIFAAMLEMPINDNVLYL